MLRRRYVTSRTKQRSKFQYTPPTRLNCRVASAMCTEFATGWRRDSLDESGQICQQRSRDVLCRRCEHTRRQSWVVTQFTTSYAVQLLRLMTSDDIMMPLLKKVSLVIKIHVKIVKSLWSLFGQLFWSAILVDVTDQHNVNNTFIRMLSIPSCL